MCVLTVPSPRQPDADLAVGLALPDERQHLAFVAGQGIEGGVRPARGGGADGRW